MRPLYRALSVVVTLAVLVASGGCAGTPKQAAEPGGRLAFFLPHAGADRYEAIDQPYFTLRMHELCPACQVDYYNAGNKHEVQVDQVRKALDSGAKVLVVDVVDSRNSADIVAMAAGKGVPIVSYDRLIVGASVAYHVSFDAVKVGHMQGQALLDAMGAKASAGRILWVNGPTTDQNAVLFSQGAHEVLDGKVQIAAEFTMPGPGYDAKAVDAWVQKTLPKLNPATVVGVYSVDDASAGVVGAALAARGVTALPPITGQNADIAGLQRIMIGKQYMTAYKPVPREAQTAADVAYAVLRGGKLNAPTTVDNRAGRQAAFLLDPVAVTRDNITGTVLRDGFVTVGSLCAAAYTDACQRAGIA
jgi:D-xylose transport system substrate-binding protein